MRECKIKKGFLTKVLNDFEHEFHVVFKDQAKARTLIEYAIAKFIVESNSPTWKDAKGKGTKITKEIK